MIQEFKELLKRETEEQGKTFELEWATTLSCFGYGFKDAIKKLKEAGIPIVLTEEEKKQTLENFYGAPISTKVFEDISDIIMVHKTDYPPKEGKIDSRYSGEVLNKCKITLGGVEYSFLRKSGRDTVHCSANHEVGANNGGSWAKKKYAVLIPFCDLKEYSRIQNAVSVDTYTRGPIKLTENCYILCPKGERENIQVENPNVTVIEYEGEYVQDYANMLIAQLGYKLELGHDHGFQNSKQDKRFYEIMEKEGLTRTSHAHSIDKHREVVLEEVYSILGIIKLIKDEKILDKVSREQLIEELNLYGFSIMVKRVLVDESREGKDRRKAQWRSEGYSEDIISATVMDSEEDFDEVFLEELRTIGIDISVEGLEKAIEENTDNEKDIIPVLKIDMDSIITGYILDSISLKDKPKKVDSRKIAEVSKEGEITSSEIAAAEAIVEEPVKKNGDIPKGEE